MKDSMEGIEAKLQIGTDIKNVLYTMDKEFALTANYPKCWTQEFYYFMKTEYPGVNLVPVVRATGGTRQDLACEGAQALYMNRKYYTKFLDQILQAEDANILDRNMDLHLKCLEIVASARVHGIVHISLVLSHRFLSGKCHKFKSGFTALHMPTVLDEMEKGLEAVELDPTKFLHKEFMQGIFSKIKDECPELKDYINYIYTQKKSMTVDKTDRIYGIREYVNKLFDPQDETNQETHELTLVLGKRWAKVWLDEFHNTGTGKNTHKCLSSAGGVWSADTDTLSDDEISKYDGTQATNNVSEKGLGIKTGQIQTHNMISFTNASAIAMAKFNKAFALDHKDKKKMATTIH